MVQYHRAREALRECLPEALRDGTFNQLLRVRWPCALHIVRIRSGRTHAISLSGRCGHEKVPQPVDEQSQ